VASTLLVREEHKQALVALAGALAQTEQFQAFEQAAAALERDEEALRAQEAYAAKLESLDLVLRLGAASEEDGAELNGLEQACDAQPAIAAHAAAQQELAALFQAVAGALSQRLGLEYASACKEGCCCG
jgi:cell fate (sporulation/competence/biofilm development) regulator YlbF (YheA/YmcA/DUF963 family)